MNPEVRFVVINLLALLVFAGVIVQMHRLARRAQPDPAERAGQAFRTAADLTLAAPWMFLVILVVTGATCWPGPIHWHALGSIAWWAGVLAVLRLASLAGASTVILSAVQLLICLGGLMLGQSESPTAEISVQKFCAAGLVFLGVQTLAWPWVRRRRRALGEPPEPAGLIA